VLRGREITTTACIARRAAAALTLAIGMSGLVHAADSAAFAAIGAQSAPTAMAGTLRVTLAMILVLGALLLAAWFARRVRGVGAAGASGIEVLAQLSLGTRERAVLIRVGGRQILVGVAPGSVRTLHVVDAAAAVAAPGDAASGMRAEIERPSFKSMLLKSLGK
jgi:flagellar protein FliO/FliZ